MRLGAGIEIDPPLLVTLAVDHAFARIEIDFTPVELHKLADPDACGREQIAPVRSFLNRFAYGI